MKIDWEKRDVKFQAQAEQSIKGSRKRQTLSPHYVQPLAQSLQPQLWINLWVNYLKSCNLTGLSLEFYQAAGQPEEARIRPPDGTRTKIKLDQKTSREHDTNRNQQSQGWAPAKSWRQTHKRNFQVNSPKMICSETSSGHWTLRSRSIIQKGKNNSEKWTGLKIFIKKLEWRLISGERKTKSTSWFTQTRRVGYRQKPFKMSLWKLPDGQWLGLGSLTAGAQGSIPGQGIKSLCKLWGAAKKEASSPRLHKAPSPNKLYFCFLNIWYLK